MCFGGSKQFNFALMMGLVESNGKAIACLLENGQVIDN